MKITSMPFFMIASISNGKPKSVRRAVKNSSIPSDVQTW
jgi:hypothetical protein